LQPDYFDNGCAVSVADAIDFGEGSLGNLFYPVACSADVGPGDDAQVVVD
jgi:hypothetical protein